MYGTHSKDHHLLDLNSKFILVFHPQYSVMTVYETLKLTLMNGAERERFCSVLLSCCPTLCFIKYLVSSVSNHKWLDVSN